MNKTQLIDALAERLGDKKIAAAAVEGLVDLVVRTVNGGDKVAITGFGVFEKRTRAARMARNPRTGESVKIEKTSVPAFRPGTLFREVVSGARKLTGTSTTPARATVAERPAEMPAAKSETKSETKTAIKARKAAAKAAKAAKKESKTATKAPTSAPTNAAPTNAAPTTVTARKAVRKSAIKK